MAGRCKVPVWVLAPLLAPFHRPGTNAAGHPHTNQTGLGLGHPHSWPHSQTQPLPGHLPLRVPARLVPH